PVEAAACHAIASRRRVSAAFLVKGPCRRGRLPLQQKRPVRFSDRAFERKVFPNYGPAPAGFRIKFDVLSQPSVAAWVRSTILYARPGRFTFWVPTAPPSHFMTLPLPSTKITTALVPPQTPPVIVLSFG